MNTELLEKLKQKRQNIQQKINKLEEQEIEEISLPTLKKSVGKCFKFINSYGSSHPKWPLYLKIISIDEKDLMFNTISFQITSLKNVEAKLEEKYNYRGRNYFDDTSYQEIPKAEFEKAKKQFLKTINNIFA